MIHPGLYWGLLSAPGLYIHIYMYIYMYIEPRVTQVLGLGLVMMEESQSSKDDAWSMMTEWRTRKDSKKSLKSLKIKIFPKFEYQLEPRHSPLSAFLFSRLHCCCCCFCNLGFYTVGYVLYCLFYVRVCVLYIFAFCQRLCPNNNIIFNIWCNII